MATALTEAETEVREANEGLVQAQANLRGAESELVTARTPIQPLLDCIADLPYLGSYRGQNGARARLILMHVSSLVAQAKAPFPAIATAEERLARCAKECRDAGSVLTDAAGADEHMQAAAKTSQKAAITAAATETARERVSAETRARLAAEAMTGAQEALAAELKAVQAFIDLQTEVQKLVELAEADDTDYRDERDRAEQQSYSSASDTGDSDCTCSMTSETMCWNCRSRQERAANEWRDSDPTR
jgi:hypothetical protein